MPLTGGWPFGPDARPGHTARAGPTHVPQAAESSPSIAGEVPLSGDEAICFFAGGLDGVDAGHCPKFRLRKTGYGPQDVTSKDDTVKPGPTACICVLGGPVAAGKAVLWHMDVATMREALCDALTGNPFNSQKDRRMKKSLSATFPGCPGIWIG